ncbi:hypothetical protein [Hyalangium gracile]|uniref:hypothetical protein n=1 Tax=Hyalangium gracile TaxID=394092 RepID=UPI001CCA80C4|nr:hypothetical protein [Hyalangium gracile]
MRLLQGLALMCGVLVGCASGPETIGESPNYGLQDGQVWVRGPWEVIKPSQDPDEVIDQLCPAVMQLPGAQLGDYGREYCGLVYSLGDGMYYASHPSPLGRTRMVGPTRHQSCFVPRRVEDTRGQTEPLADYHGHPWAPSPMSESRADRLGATQVFSIRVQFDKACRLQKLIPYLKEDRPGELYERRGKSWKLIGHIEPANKANGRVTLVTE